MKPGASAHPALLLLTFAAALGTFSMHLFVPALPGAAHDLAVSDSAIQQVVSVYLWGLALGQVLSGPVVDRFGERKMLLVGLGTYTIGAAAGALAPTLGALLVARLVQALGACVCLVVARSAVSRGRPAADAISGLSIITLGITISSTVAPLIGLTMLSVLDWRFILALLATCGFAIGITAFLVMRAGTEHAEPAPRFGDTIGAFTSMLRSSRFIASTLLGSIATVGIYAFYTALPFLLREEFPSRNDTLGIIYLCIAAGSIGGASMSRFCSERMPVLCILWIGSLGIQAGAIGFLLGRIYLPESITAMTLPLAVMTFAGGFIAPASLALATSKFRKNNAAASSLYGTVQMTVGALASFVVSIVGHGSISVGIVLLTLASAATASLISLTRMMRSYPS